MKPALPPVTILAGGMASRMGGGDKPLLYLGAWPILTWMLSRIPPSAHPIAISANGDPARFSSFAGSVIADRISGVGPMAGILSAMEWASEHGMEASHVLILSGDTPFLPLDLVPRLSELATRYPNEIITASSGGRIHPAIGFWPLSAQAEIRHALQEGRDRKLMQWLDRLGYHAVSWPNEPYDPFFNINMPEDLARAATIAAEYDLAATIDRIKADR